MLINVLAKKKPNKLFIYYAIHTKKGTPLGVSFFVSEAISNIPHYYLVHQKERRFHHGTVFLYNYL